MRLTDRFVSISFRLTTKALIVVRQPKPKFYLSDRVLLLEKLSFDVEIDVAKVPHRLSRVASRLQLDFPPDGNRCLFCKLQRLTVVT